MTTVINVGEKHTRPARTNQTGQTLIPSFFNIFTLRDRDRIYLGGDLNRIISPLPHSFVHLKLRWTERSGGTFIINGFNIIGLVFIVHLKRRRIEGGGGSVIVNGFHIIVGHVFIIHLKRRRIEGGGGSVIINGFNFIGHVVFVLLKLGWIERGRRIFIINGFDLRLC